MPAIPAGQGMKRMQQRHGIRAAGDRHQDVRAGGKQGMVDGEMVNDVFPPGGTAASPSIQSFDRLNNSPAPIASRRPCKGRWHPEG
jgi:hypothetical protein